VCEVRRRASIHRELPQVVVLRHAASCNLAIGHSHQHLDRDVAAARRVKADGALLDEKQVVVLSARLLELSELLGVPFFARWLSARSMVALNIDSSAPRCSLDVETSNSS